MADVSPIQNLINAMGTVAETIYIANREFLRVGFSEKDSLYLTAELMKFLFTPKNNQMPQNGKEKKNE